MAIRFRGLAQTTAATALAGLVGLGMLAGDLRAQAQQQQGEPYIATIWVDPDGCEHWVMDDGAEGYMDIRLRRDGTPICRRGPTCAVFESDQLFATDKWRLNDESRRRLAEFFSTDKATGFVISGHTDSRASDAYNMGLSQRRATSVAEVARSVGANVVEVRWYGERNPVATNATAAGMAKNRRVEIECVG